MNQLSIIKDYKSDNKLRLSFNQLANQIFGIDFEKWYQAGGWSANYIPWSFIHNQKVVANVSVNKLTMFSEGLLYKVIQIGTVMTHSDYRNQGLCTALINKVMDHLKNECDFFYLFPEENAIHFYEKFGFQTAHDFQYTLNLKSECVCSQNNLLHLDLENGDDFSLFNQILDKRIYNSDIFYIGNSNAICRWYVSGLYANNIYYSPRHQIILIYKLDQNKNLHLFDFIADKKWTLKELQQLIRHEFYQKIIFYFTPYRAILESCSKSKNEIMMIAGDDFLLNREFSHPVTAHA